MQAFDQIQELWQKHDVAVKVSADEMLQQAKKEVNGLKFKSALNLLGMLASFMVIGAVWIFSHFQLWTSHVGFIIFLIAILSSTLILLRDHRLISKSDITAHPRDFLDSLKTYQVNRYFLYNQMWWFYTVSISLGFVFSFIEILPAMSMALKTIFIVLTGGWIIFCSTILRKAIVKRERERISLLIEKFERISSQISSPEQF